MKVPTSSPREQWFIGAPASQPGVRLEFLAGPQFNGHGWAINNTGQIAGVGSATSSSSQNAGPYTTGADAAIVACMRNLNTMLNAMRREQTPWNAACHVATSKSA